MPMQYAAIFNGCKNDKFQLEIFDISLIFAKNIDCGYTLTSTHNLCFRAKIRKNVHPCKPQFYYSLYKKKRKHYIIFNNLRTFKDEHFKLTGDID